MKGEPTQTLVQRLCAGDEREGYAALKELLERSRTGREISLYWEELAALLAENGLLILTAGSRLRLLPPLTITKDEMDKGLAILKQTLAQ